MSLSRGRGDPKLMNLVQRTNQVPSAADVLEKPVMSVHIVYETHSTSLDNERGIATGWLGGELSAQGREQARELGQRRRHDSIDVVFASDLNRAVETAQIAFAETGIPVRFDWRLRECNYGSMNGMPRSRLDTERGLRLDEPFPGGESWLQAITRVRGFLDELPETHEGRRVVVIGHVATRWALDCFIDGRRLEDLVDEPFEWREGWEYTLDAAAHKGV
jgi:broad specificity phosphatase PhoE